MQVDRVKDEDLVDERNRAGKINGNRTKLLDYVGIPAICFFTQAASFRDLEVFIQAKIIIDKIVNFNTWLQSATAFQKTLQELICEDRKNCLPATLFALSPSLGFTIMPALELFENMHAIC